MLIEQLKTVYIHKKIIILGLILLLLFSLISTANAIDWYNTTWEYRQQITISSTMTQTDLTNFPVLIKIADQNNPVFNKAQADADDILFTLSDGITKLDHEIEYYQNTGTKELDAWVRIPALSSSTNTTIYMYYGNSNASNQQNPTGIWNSNYKGVWHLKEEQAGTGNLGLYQDATINNNNGNDYISAIGQGGKVSSGKEFDGTDDYVITPSNQSLGVTAKSTVEAWVYLRSTSGGRLVYEIYSPTAMLHYINFPSGSAKPKAVISGVSGRTLDFASTINLNEWTHLAITYNKDGGADNFKTYINGVLSSQATRTGTMSGTQFAVAMGMCRVHNAGAFNGYIDEVRISDVARSADWIKASYNNQNNPGGYLSFAIEESWYNPSWSYRQQITISSAMTQTDLTNFPVLIKIADQNNPVFTNAQADGDDIVFTLSDGITKIDHEIEYYQNTGAKELDAWVRIPALSSSTNTTIYMYYGNSNASNQQNLTGVWNSNYKGVWHLKEEQAGTGNLGLHQDATINNNNGNDYISAIGQGGKVNSGKEFDGTDDYVITPSNASLGVKDRSTVEAWVYLRTTSGGRLVYEIYSPTAMLHYINFPSGSAKPKAVISGVSGGTLDFASAINLNEWTYLAVTYDKDGGTNNFKTYINGVLSSQATGTGTMSGTQFAVAMGMCRVHNAGPFNGFIDEVRISDIARSDDWIKASYNIQNNTGSYLSFAVEEQGEKTPIVWTGGGADNLVSNPANWSGNVVPQNGDNVVFDGTNNCMWDINITPASINLNSGFTGIVQLNSDLTITGNLTIAGGTLNLNNKNLNVDGYILIDTYGTFYATSSTITLKGVWANYGNFIPGTSTVILNGTNQAIYGNTTFYNLTKTVTSTDTLYFEAGSAQTILNSLTLQGASGGLLALRSTQNGSYWYIDPQGTRNISFVDIKDMNNLNIVSIVTTNSVNSGNNTNVSFGGSECACLKDSPLSRGDRGV